MNVAAPNPLHNFEFLEALRDAWGMPNGIPAPAPLIEIGAFFLRTESELVLKSRRVVPRGCSTRDLNSSSQHGQKWPKTWSGSGRTGTERNRE